MSDWQAAVLFFTLPVGGSVAYALSIERVVRRAKSKRLGLLLTSRSTVRLMTRHVRARTDRYGWTAPYDLCRRAAVLPGRIDAPCTSLK